MAHPEAVRALVIVDVQRDFLDPTLPAGVGSWQKAFCVPGLQRLLDHARRQEWHVVHVGTRHENAETLPQHHRRSGINLYCKAGTPGCDFVLSPQEDETVLYKTWYSAFVDTRLARHISGVTEIIWAGVSTDCCIQQSVFDADRLGFRSIVPLQAVAASSGDAFVASLVAIAKSVGEVVDLEEALHGISTTQALAVEAIRELARAWFDDQQQQLGNA